MARLIEGRAARSHSSSRIVLVALIALMAAFVSERAHAAPTARFTAAPIQGATCVAPCAIHFDATETTDPAVSRPFHTLDYHWDFGDPGSGVWPVSGRSRNEAFGGIAGHLFQTPGSYDVCLTVTAPGGASDRTCRVVTVSDPRATFSQSHTWCIANDDSNWSGCPAGANRLVTNSWDTATAAGACDVSNAKRWCRFRRGDRFQGTRSRTPFAGAAPGLIDSFGSGSAPHVSMTGTSDFLFVQGSSGWTVSGLSVDMNGGVGSVRRSFQVNAEASRFTAHDVRVDKISACAGFSAGGGVRHPDLMAFVGLSCTAIGPGAQNVVSAFVRGERLLFLGNEFDNNYSAEFVMRTIHFPRSIIQHSRMQRPGTASNRRNVLQIRAWAGSANARCGVSTPSPGAATQYVIVSDNHFSQDGENRGIRTCQTNECSIQCTNDGNDNDSNCGCAVDLTDVIFERNFFAISTGGGQGPFTSTTGVFHLQGGDITVRNNVVDLQGIAPGEAPRNLVRHDGNARPGLRSDRVHIYANTVYSQTPIAGNFTVCAGGSQGTGHLCASNLLDVRSFAGQKRASFGGAWAVRGNLFATTMPFASPPPGQGLTSPTHFQLGAQATAAIDADLEFSEAEDHQLLRDFANRCRPVDGTGDGNAAWDVGAWERAADGSCLMAVPEPAGGALGLAALLGLAWLVGRDPSGRRSHSERH